MLLFPFLLNIKVPLLAAVPVVAILLKYVASEVPFISFVFINNVPVENGVDVEKFIVPFTSELAAEKTPTKYSNQTEKLPAAPVAPVAPTPAITDNVPPIDIVSPAPTLIIEPVADNN